MADADDTPRPAPNAFARLRHWKRTWVNGWHRWPKEHFTVWLGRVGGEASAVRAPRGSYYADPFLWRQDGADWLFVEEFLYAQHTARIVAVPLRDGRPAGPAQPLGLPAGHTSFPAVFAHGDGLYLLPETVEQRAVDLYRCAQFPARWVRHRRLLADIDAADPVLLAHGGRWWLFVAVRSAGESGRHLEIFHAADFAAAEWTAHPVNAERLPAAGPRSRQRAAGLCHVLPSGELLRPVQTSPRYYGQGLVWKRIVELTPERFVECDWTGALPGALGVVPRGAHHVSVIGEWAAWDVRDRVSYAQHLPGIGRQAGPDFVRWRPRLSGESAPVTLLTAADEPYGRCLYQFLRSVERLGLEHRHRVVVGDLGLAPGRRAGLARRFPWCEFVRFPFEQHPPHLAPRRRSYAWKPVFISDVAAQSPRVLWFDSATVLHAPPDEVEAWLDRSGVYSLAGQATLRERCAAAAAAAFGASAVMLAHPERVGGVVGFDTSRPVAARILAHWRMLGLDEAMIGVTTRGHQSDQAMLSLLLGAAAERGELEINPGEIDISSGRPVRWMASRQKLPPWLPYWADAPARWWFRAFKAADQWLHRRKSASGR